ncbi:MAG: flavodoxin family protein [Oscillospiraceae bacterium]
MKVLLINGSPNEKGCTYTALTCVANELQNCGLETEIFHVGTEPIRGCMGCGACAKSGLGKCVYDNDTVNIAIEKMKTADGLIVGSPVHYAAASGAITSFLDRMFYSGGKTLAFKPGASIASCRRGGASATFDQLNKYFTIANMPLISSNYWNMVHGSVPSDVLKDEEGVQTMRVLGRNMAWIIKAIDAGVKCGVEIPTPEVKIKTNYIR